MNRSRQAYVAIRAKARSNRALDVTWRLVVFVVGSTLVALGLFFLLFPGPGWATIVLGLVVLGSEFRWANRALHPITNIANRLAQRVVDPRHRARTAGLTTVAIAAGIACLYIYVSLFGWTLTGLRLLLPS